MDRKKRTQKKTAAGSRNRRRRKPYHGQGLFSAVILCCLLLFAYGFLVAEGYWQLPNSVPEQPAGDSAGTVSESETENVAGNSQENSGADSLGNSLTDPDNGNLEVHYIDVGQGDATLIKCGGETLLIDAGDESKGTAIQYYLMKQGVEKLDYLVLTHPDADHIGSADVVLTKFQVQNVIMSYYEKDNTSYQNLLEALEYKRLTPQIAKAGQSFTVGGARCTVLGPVREYEEPNNASVILLVEHGENRFLFTGDAESQAEEDLVAYYLDQDEDAARQAGETARITQEAQTKEGPTASVLRADVYKAGHHGSSTSSTESFLDAVNPAYAVISCAKDNDYGHPHAEILERFQERNIRVYRTDEQGTVTAVSDGVQITWQEQ